MSITDDIKLIQKRMEKDYECQECGASCGAVHRILDALEKRTKALESIEWITGYEDGGKNTCIANKTLVKEALEEG